MKPFPFSHLFAHHLARQFYKYALMQHAPQKPVLFMEQFLKKNRKLADDFWQIVNYFDSEDGSDYLYNLFRLRHASLAYLAQRFYRALVEENTYGFKYFLELYPNSGWYQALESCQRNLKNAKEDVEKIKASLERELKGFDAEYLSFMSPGEYGPYTKEDVEKIFSLDKILGQAVDVLEYTEIKLQKFLEKLKLKEGEKPKRDGGNIEILYHTTSNLSDLLTKGFQKEWKENQGLGGSNSLKSGGQGVSFTSNLYVAKEIMRTLKESIMIAHGELKARDILEWAKDDGILNEVVQTTKSTWSTSLETPEGAFNLYRAYLAHTTSWDRQKSLRYNPLFMSNIVPLLKNKSQQDVGILVCEVDMDSPDINYLGSMDEYRVPVEAIVKIVKVLQ